MTSNVQIIILAAGKGTRMETDNPKALTLLSSKTFLAHVLDTVDKLNLPLKPIIVVGYQKEKIIDTLGNVYHFAEQKEQLGTGHAVLVAKEKAESDHDVVVVLYADHPLISSQTILNMIKKQKETGAPVVMAPTIIPNYENWYSSFIKWGRIKRDSAGKISGIVEYKDANDEEKNITEITPGYFAFDAKWMWENLKKLDNNNAQNEYYLTYLVNIALAENKIVESIQIPPEEAIGANSKEELEILEKLIK